MFFRWFSISLLLPQMAQFILSENDLNYKPFENNRKEKETETKQTKKDHQHLQAD